MYQIHVAFYVRVIFCLAPRGTNHDFPLRCVSFVLLTMVFSFDDPAAYFSPEDDEDIEVWDINRMGTLLRGEAIPDLTTKTDIPPVSAWKKQTGLPISITVDKAREESMKQAEREISHIKSRVKNLMDIGDNDTDQDAIINKIVNNFFGPQSRLYRCFADNLKENGRSLIDGNHKLFLRFIGSFYLSCWLGLTVEEMFADDICGNLLLTAHEYNLVWSWLYEKRSDKDYLDQAIPQH